MPKKLGLFARMVNMFTHRANGLNNKGHTDNPYGPNELLPKWNKLVKRNERIKTN